MVGGDPKVLAIITARGGSKGVPGKNLRPLAGRPLIEWTIRAAQSAKCVTHVIISTDAPEIAAVAASSGVDVPFIRPAELASDTAGSADVVAHAIDNCPGYDYFVLLQPTSPLRTGFDIDGAFAQMREAGAHACVSVSEALESPWLMYRHDDKNVLHRLLPSLSGGMQRQNLPTAYILNGAIYFSAVEAFRKSRKLVPDTAIGHVMPHDRAIDIDTVEDFALAEKFFKEGCRGVSDARQSTILS